MNEYLKLLILCFILAIVVNQITHRIKDVHRSKYAVLAVGAISGFASFIIALLLLKVTQMHWALLGGVVAIIYAYIMANAKGFKNIK